MGKSSLKPGETISFLRPDGTGPTLSAEAWNKIASDPKGFAEKVVGTGRQGRLDGSEEGPTFEVTRIRRPSGLLLGAPRGGPFKEAR